MIHFLIHKAKYITLLDKTHIKNMLQCIVAV